ncbi:NADH-quinone oxidoreductase subunit E [Sulfitobacter pseudonitzschiae]|uniref:NADH-quinone oxidoreductase subunit E n=1 Tax=Pseudosulfitobacter pseudonitzschiae TaxID=1402135 RepID=A0A9Q2NID3_9RHOB|nr:MULTISPECIES: NADH-quinone oxidoreductase subunit E [Roseobacteraceae]MBM2291284.1 NADH-quinone oxidoreductase subunit E [Pseudosulfitobacter pseudonitzschiae]MBM2296202.1 NADH-quinone oxidoreductase subunit E [Pseudosulfitobacter pseudonitzschiae]MBM2301115.1 NADH-quinone oxidoreductase subunit E [Pseudosulfitobacter pseudonitzschiae]MBM2310899.1 NADH-quinone oxidoreductase subunit E [Pseudosulfitobacter pseudonitzschiae]MBM2315812.1 NADH-quinone oxidoreductase subunit E [Pseudosulfitobact|tara:strand:- start:31891 stop:33066 length:1176 start_codon:yes stop_codon:yes gene_type:complete
MLRRLHPDQPESFAFTPANQAWAEAQITKYPEGRQASAIIALLWRAQEQEGWLTRPAIESVCEMLGMAYIRGLEVASFYFMFQLQPVGSVAHIQVCGTTSCMICGAEDLMAVCKKKIAAKPHELSADGKFSWEEVECLGSCANAPMAQIGKDYYEDLTTDRMAEIIDELAAGRVPVPGPQNGRYASEPLSGLTSLTEYDSGKTQYNASAQLATDIGDTIKRIDGTEVPLTAPWQGKAANASGKPPAKPKTRTAPSAPVTETKAEVAPAPASEAQSKAKPPRTEAEPTPAAEAGAGKKPRTMKAPRKAGADDLKLIKGVGPKLEAMLNEMGYFHYDQIAKWGPAEVEWADQNLVGFKGRVSRDNWVEQAGKLAAGEQTEFSNRAKKDGIYNK